MRAFIVVTVAALGLAACGTDEQANNTVNIDQAVMSEELAANDVTAIDAVTGDAADMAADVDINFTEELAEDSGNQSGARPERAKSRPRTSAPRPATNTAASAPEPAANAVANEAE